MRRMDMSDELFAIVDPVIRLTSPAEGDTLIAGRTDKITWESTDIDKVLIEFSGDGGESWDEVIGGIEADGGSYRWTVPELESEECVVRISDAGDALVTDGNEGTFAIEIPALALTSPVGGEEWIAGTMRDITWDSSNIDVVRIFYTVDGGETWELVVKSFPAHKGSYSWTLPKTPADECLVKVVDRENGERFSETAEPITIVSSVGMLSGAVVDAQTGDPLSGVTVTMTARLTNETDEAGEYEIADIPPGDYALVFRKGGYIDVREENVPVRPGDDIVLDAALIPKTGPVVTELRVNPDPTSGSGVITVNARIQTNVVEKIAPFSTVEKIAGGGLSKPAASGTSIKVGNSFVEARVSRNGEVSVQTANNRRLTDPRLFPGSTLLRVDGVSYEFGGSRGRWKLPLYSTNNKVQGIWSAAGIEVVFSLSIVQGTTTRKFDTFRMDYELKNTDTQPHEAGLYRLIDPMINTNDEGPISAGDVFNREAREFTGDAVPSFWQAYERAPDQIMRNIVVQGTLSGGGAVKPDRLVIDDMERLEASGWDAAPGVGEYTDSGVGMWWNPVTLASGDGRRIGTLYGPGRIDTGLGDLVLSVAAERTLFLVDNELEPNPFQVTAIVTNRSGVTVSDIEMFIELPNGLNLSDGERMGRTVALLENGASAQVRWRVRAEEYGADQPYVYKVIAGSSRNDISDTIVNKAVSVPGVLRGLFVKGGELFIGDDPGEGNGIPMQPMDGRFDSAAENATRTVNIGTLEEGVYTVHVRGIDSEGDWGDVTAYEFLVNPPEETNIFVYPGEDIRMFARRTVKIPIHLDVSQSEYKVGEYQAFITWPAEMLAFVSVTPGEGPGTGLGSRYPLVKQTDNTDQGELTVSYVNTKGIEGTLEIMNLIFKVIGAGGSRGDVRINMTSMSSTETFTNLLPMTEVTPLHFMIVDTAIWGDVDNNEHVQNRDAFIIMTHSVGRDVGDYLSAVLARGDVNADGAVNTTDALICKSYSIDPDNPNLPQRVGKPIGSVPKPATGPPGAAVLPSLLLTGTGDGLLVEPVLTPDVSGILIGAADVTVTWDASAYRFIGIDEAGGDVVANTDRASGGEIRIARISVDGDERFALPRIRLIPLAGGDGTDIVCTVTSAADAETFASLAGGSGEGRKRVGDTRPAQIVLQQNVPNPFNPVTTISYTLTDASRVTLTVYNVQGQQVATLVDGYQGPGLHTVTWNATDSRGAPVSSGVYLYQVTTPAGRQRKQMLLLR